MMWRKWRIAGAMERGRSARAERLAKRAGLQRYQQSLATLDELLREGADEAQQEAPAHLPARIMDEVGNQQRLRTARSRWRTVSQHRWRAVAAAAAVLLIAAAAWVYIAALRAAETESSPLALVLNQDQPEPQRAATIHVAFPGQPVGRLVMERLGTPLMNEVELLRRDTQNAADFVLSSLPFARQ